MPVRPQPAPPLSLRARVHGGGPTGALTALALAQAGWWVELLDPLTAEQLCSRSRAYALTHSSRTLLQALGLWQGLVQHLAPFRRLELCDRAIGRRTQFTAEDLPAGQGVRESDTRADAGRGAVGWILQHRPLMEVLLQAVSAEPLIEAQLGTTVFTELSAELPPEPPTALSSERRSAPARQGPVDLVVAADGHASPTRRAAGLRHGHLPYRQGCLTVQVGLRGSEPDQAWELFRPEGPFAVLPLGGEAFQLVWSGPLTRLRQLEQLEPVLFLEALSAALPEQLQAEVLLDQPRAFPVALELGWPLARRRTVLVGEAAHRCHPVGGQGLNLCWRDVAVLQQLARRAAAGRLRPRRLPAAYARRRWLDILLVLLATDALVRLFSNRQPLLLPLRQLALAALARYRWLRRLCLSAMTDGPCRLRWH